MDRNRVVGFDFELTMATPPFSGLLTWWGICILYIRFHNGMKAQGIDRSTLPYHSKLNNGAFAAKYALTFITIILFFFAWNVFQDTKSKAFAANLLTNYLPQALFPMVYFGYKLIKKTSIIKTHEMDFVSGVDEIEAEEEEEVEPQGWFKKALSWVF
jgi:amino acid transporter